MRLIIWSALSCGKFVYICTDVCVCVFISTLTDKLLVPDVQSHVPEGGGHRTHHLVIVDPQQLHQDGQTLLFAHGSPDVHRPLAEENQS